MGLIGFGKRYNTFTEEGLKRLIQFFIIVWLFWAFTDMVIGREEFDKQHKISIIIASALLIPSILYTRNNHRSNYCCCYTGLSFTMNYSITLKFQF